MLSDHSLARLGEVHPELCRRVIRLDVLVPQLSIQVVQGFRSWADQDALYAQGRTAAGPIVTNAKGGQSAHCFGYAVDLVPEDVTPGIPDWNAGNQAWKKMLAAALACGLAEGSAWEHKDNPHCYLQELPADPTDEMRRILSANGLQALWQSWAPLLVISQ